jgi:hypothetical protein
MLTVVRLGLSALAVVCGAPDRGATVSRALGAGRGACRALS